MRKIIYEFDQSMVTSLGGVYAVLIDNHVYVGSTKRNLIIRLKEHEKFLMQNKHSNHRMQLWFNQSSSVTFMILEYCSPKRVCKREQYYIDKYNPDINIVKHVAKY